MRPSAARPRPAPRPQTRPWACAALLGLLALTLAGCPPPRYPWPETGFRQPAELLQALRQEAAPRQSVRGEARIELFSEQGYAPHSQVLVAERPGRLHVEALSPFDLPLAILTCDGERFQLYTLQDQTFYRGPATPENLARLLPLPLAAPDLVLALLQSAPLLESADALEWDGEQRQYVLRLSSPARGLRQTLRVDPTGPRVVASRLEDAEGELVYSLSFAQFVGSGPARWAREMQFEMPAQEIEMTVRWKDWELNAALPAEAWAQEPPRGARVEELP